MKEQPKEPRPKSSGDKKEVNPNVAGMVVGFVLFCMLIWSLVNQEMQFAYLTSTLLFALAVFNHLVNMMYS